MKLFRELYNRTRLAFVVLIWGDFINGNIVHLKAMEAELDFIITHKNDLSKDEIVKLVAGDPDRCQTGMLHHLRHILQSQNWRIVYAQMVDSQLTDAKERVLKALK